MRLDERRNTHSTHTDWTTGAAPLKTMPQAPPDATLFRTSTQPDNQPLTRVASVASDTGAQDASSFAPPGCKSPSASGEMVQQRTYPTVEVRLRGGGLRAGYQVNIPQLVSFGGAAVTALGGRTAQGIYASAGVPILYALWDLRYRVYDIPSLQFPVAANPAMAMEFP